MPTQQPHGPAPHNPRVSGDVRRLTTSSRHARKEQAALLVSQDEQTDEEIARTVSCTRRTLTRWKREPDFQARVSTIQTEFAEKILAEGITSRQNRLDELNDRHRKLKRVIDERSADEGLQGAPGGSTGLVVVRTRSIGYGRDAELVREYAVDVALLKEMRATEQQAAQEAGQWAEKHEHSGEVLVRRYIGVDLDAV